MKAPDEILVYGAGEYLFYPADYPWAKEFVLTAAGGAASNGNPGTSETRRFHASELPWRLRIVCGQGGRAADGRRGEDGFVLIELYS
jgi:hypothetical protein